jgi:UDP-glucose 4-epimerase
LRYFNASGAAADGSIGEDHDPETHLIPISLHVALGQRSHVDIFGTDYPTPDGTCVRDYIHVDDLAAAHILALEKIAPGSRLAYNVGIGRGYSVREVIETAQRVTGKPIAVREAARRPGDPPVLVADAGKATRELGWTARYTELTPIVETAWNWHKSHPRGFGDRS